MGFCVCAVLFCISLETNLLSAKYDRTCLCRPLGRVLIRKQIQFFLVLEKKIILLVGLWAVFLILINLKNVLCVCMSV